MTAVARLPYRMKDLSERTGLPRQVIHFYIQQGLVPEGKKTGRNMAWYGDEHVARIRLVRQLQSERFLPLKAIRAVLGETKEPFTPEQRTMLLEVKERLAEAMGPVTARYVDAREVLAKSGVGERDLREMIDCGLVAGVESPGAKGRKKALRVASDDVWILEAWGEVRAAGFSRALGFLPKDLLVIEEALDKLFAWETATLTTRLAGLPAADVGAMIQKALPLLESFLVRAHERKVRNFFAQIGG